MSGEPTALAVAQFAVGDDPEANLDAIRRLAEDAASRGAMLVAFPEYSAYFTPGLGPDWVEQAQPIHGRFVRAVAEIAAELGIHIVAGMTERIPDDEERVANTLVALGPDGDLVARYRKLHLFDAFGHQESRRIAPGPIEEPQTFRFGPFTVGLETCYDLRFPEVTRRLVDAGADLVVLPAQWVPGALKEQQWRTLLAARAIENEVYLAAPAQLAPHGAGNSLVLDPAGVEVAALGETEGVAVAWLDHDRVTEVRHRNPVLELRRFTVAPR
jgi:predicted amidohydrolase